MEMHVFVSQFATHYRVPKMLERYSSINATFIIDFELLVLPQDIAPARPDTN